MVTKLSGDAGDINEMLIIDEEYIADLRSWIDGLQRGLVNDFPGHSSRILDPATIRLVELRVTELTDELYNTYKRLAWLLKEREDLEAFYDDDDLYEDED